MKYYGTRHANASVDVFMGDSTAPVINAIITVENSTAKGKTNKNGHCTVSPVAPGMHTITVTAPGFPNPVTSQALEFVKGKPTYFTFNMTEFNLPVAKEKKVTVNSGE